LGVRIHDDGIDETAGSAGRRVVADEPFAHAPPVVASSRDDIDLFPRVLTDVADPKIARLSIEREAPGIPKAVGEDLLLRRRAAAEWIVRRNGIGLPPLDVDAEHLTEEHPRVLRALSGIPRRATVTEAGIQKAVGAEDDVAAVVVRVRLIEREEHVGRIFQS